MEKRYTTSKKILFLITKSNFGGAQRYVYDLATNLPKDMYERVVVLGGSGTLTSKLSEKDVRVITLSKLRRDVSIFKDISSFFEIIKILRKEKPSILHINSSKAGVIGALAGRIVGTSQIIFTAHAWAFNENRNLISKYFIKILHWLTVAMSNKTITVSDAVKDQMLNTPFISRKMTTVHLGIVTQRFVDKFIARKKLGIPEDIFAIGTIAELHPIKGLSYAIGAVNDLSVPYSYSIIGDGELKNELKNEIGQNKNSSSVSLKGFIENASTLLTAFDVFVLPSLSEALGYVLLEAGLAKVPIIATNVGGIPEIMKPGMGILVESKNSIALQNAIENVIKNKNEATLMAENLNKWVTQEFSLEKMIEKTISIYENN